MSIWKKFTEIDNSYNEKKLTNIRQYVDSNLQWVVTEKIDGENASINISPEGIRIGKRSSLFPVGSKFGKVLEVAEKHKDSFMSAYNYIIERYSKVTNELNEESFMKINSVTFFGESFGGVYPHKDVEKAINAKKIQGRVFYCPDNDFLIFDIAMTMEDIEGYIKNVYLDFNDVEQICCMFNLPYIKPLFFGTFEECLNYDVNFVTTIPYYYNLPRIEDNFTEGIVIKPVKEQRFGNGERVILKKKSEKFSEKRKSNNAFIINKEDYSLELVNAMSLSSMYITENRLMNIISHFGEVSNKDFGPVLKEFNEDVLKDMYRECDISIDILDKKDLKLLKKYINNECSKLMKKEFFKHA